MINHSALENIKSVRPITNPIWKMAITPSEYDSLKTCLCVAYYENNLFRYPNEAAICYAEWWKTEYDGGFPSEENIAKAIGLPKSAGKALYNAAKNALGIWKVPIIKHKNSLRFRTLLLQGGLPIRHVMNNLSGYTMFLKGLVAELSQINVDWEDTSIIPQLDCSSYLPKSLCNDDIYSLCLQIARAIIEERDDLLPYDNESDVLRRLTETLQEERKRVKNIVRRKPLSFKWELSIKKAGETNRGYLRYSLESVKNLYVSSLEGFQAKDCYQFDLYVSKRYVATYKRVSSDGSEEVYRRLNTSNILFDWNGEPFIEVKVICDSGESFFITVIGCYPPDFSNPQLFQLNERVYVQQKNISSSDNIVIFSNEWQASDAAVESLNIGEDSYRLVHFTDIISLTNIHTNEIREIRNKFTSYAVGYMGTFIEWLEDSNYALLNKAPYIVAYDENDIIVKEDLRPSFRKKNFPIWTKLQRHTVLPTGLIEIKVTLPDGQNVVKTFYSIGDLSFASSSEEAYSGIIQCTCSWGKVYPKKQIGLQYEPLGYDRWRVTRPQDNQFPATCTFEILTSNSKNLEISVASPFKGICLVQRNGEVVKNGAILSMTNLLNYTIVEKGAKRQKLLFSYTDKKEDAEYTTLSTTVGADILPLSNFEETVTRLYDLYGNNHFDRSNAVSLQINRSIYYLRYFTLDSIRTARGTIKVVKLSQMPHGKYEGKLFACPAVDPYIGIPIGTVELNRIDDNEFAFPDECSGGYIVFSDVYDKDRIVPKYYKVGDSIGLDDMSGVESVETTQSIKFNSLSELAAVTSNLGLKEQDAEVNNRAKMQWESIHTWSQALSSEDVAYSSNWEKVVEYMDVASQYRLPFGTFNAISAAVSSPSLFAKLLLRLYLDGKNEQAVSEINKLEREYAIAAHWLRPSDFDLVIKEIEKESPKLINILLRGFSEFIKDLLSVTLDSDSAVNVSLHMMGNKEHYKTTVLTPSDIRMFRSRAIGKSDNNRDLPVESLPLRDSYYGVNGTQGMTGCQMTLIHSPLYAFEYIAKKNNDLWQREQLSRRRAINFYRRYFMRSYCEILTKLMK